MDKPAELLKEVGVVHVPPDRTTEYECSEDAKAELLDQCDHIWIKMEECQSRLTQLGTEMLPETDVQLSLLMMQVKSLTAEYNQWQKRDPQIISTNQEVLLALGKHETEKVQRELEMVLSSVRSKNRKLEKELKIQQQWLEEQQKLVQSLASRQDELKNQVLHFSEKRVSRDIEDRIENIRTYTGQILLALGEFLEDHFPLPEEHGQSSKKKKSLPGGPTTKQKALHEILENLMNKLLLTPNNPYLIIDESYWPPYIELLLRYGIALRHPEDPNRIRLEAFHQ